MSKSNTLENGFLALYFHGTALANVADNTASAPATSLYVSLYTADPTDAASTAAECAYSGYARVAVPRSSAGWTVSGNTVNPAAVITFPVIAASPGAEPTHFGISRTLAGAPDFIGSLTDFPSWAIGYVPRITTASSIVED
jgi:hypothetical protein